MQENSDLDLEFISPFPLLNCVQRLEGRHEKSTLFAWRWQRRLVVQVWKIQEGLYGFKLRSVGKSAFEVQLVSTASVQGYLKAINSDETAVLAQRRINYFMIVLLSLVLGVAIGLVFGVNPEYENRVVIGLVVGLLSGGASLFFGLLDAYTRTRIMIGVVEESLGYLRGL